MTSKTLLFAVLLLGTLLVLQSPIWGHIEQQDMAPKGTLLVEPAAQGPMTRNFTVYVGTTGFNSTGSTGITLTVTEGDRVTIRFVYNDTDLGYNNPHEVFIEGYGLSSGTIDRATRERTVTFTANIPGQATFRCTAKGCVGHASLLDGVLDVQRYAGPQIPTSLSLSAQASMDNVTLYVQAADSLSGPVAGILVRFYRDSTWGFAEIGSAATNSSGGALLVYSPPAPGEITFKAQFTGSGMYSPSSSPSVAVSFTRSTDSGPDFPFVWGQNTLVDIRVVGVPALSGLLWIGMVFVIAASVWATYLYVARQLLGIWEEGEKLSLRYGEQEVHLQRAFSYPTAVITGIGMVALGYADILVLTFVIPALSLLAFPLLAFIEAVLIAVMVSRKP